MADRTNRKPLWEDADRTSLKDLVGLMALEMWARTGSPGFAAQIAEAELAHVRAHGSWRTYLALAAAYGDEATTQAIASATFGFQLGLAMGERLSEDLEELFTRALVGAELVPMSAEVRAEAEQRTWRANDACYAHRDDGSDSAMT
jgi:hypothetical protein